MSTLGKFGEAIGALLAIPFTIFFFYVAYLVVAWSWDFLLWAAGVALVGLILLGIAGAFDEARADGIKRGSSTTMRLLQTIGGHAARSFSVACFAIAVGLGLTAIFQGVVLSGGDNLYARDVMVFEESVLNAKLWLDAALGLDILAGILVLAAALSLLLPLKSLVERTLSVRRVLSFVYVVLLTLTSFTFFAGLALRPYELVQREILRSKAAFAFQDQDMDARKSLVAVAWILDELNDPAATPIPPDLVERLRGHLKRSPYDDEVDTAAWRIAGFNTVMYFTDDDSRRLERFKTEADIHAQDGIASDAAAGDGFKSLRAFVTSLLGDAFAGFKAETGPQATHYLRVLNTVQPPGQPRPATWRESALAQAHIAALEILSSALADKIGGAVTSEEFRRHFVGELVQAVVAPLWDVALPLDIKDVASARAFVSAQRLDRAPLDWAKLADLSPVSAEQAVVAATPDADAGQTTGPGSTSPFAAPMQLPSWQNFDSATTFVVLPPVGASQVYTRPAVRFR